ncbi:MAG: PHP domain-containing protein [Promethearchaeota archaeon]
MSDNYKGKNKKQDNNSNGIEMDKPISRLKNLKNALKRKILLVIAVPIFAIWIIFLILLTYFGGSNATFFDYLANADVTSQYSIKIPLFRYLIEPICGLVFVVGKGNIDWLLLFLVSYPIFRAIYLLIDKFRYNWRIKYHVVMKSFKEALDFMLICFFISLFVILFVLLGIYSIKGTIGIADNYHEVLHGTIWIILILTGYKFIENLYSKITGRELIKPAIKNKIKQNIKAIFRIKNKKAVKRRIRKKKRPSEYKGIQKIIHYGVWEILTLIEIVGLLFFTNFIALSINLPTQKIETNLSSNEFLFDFHVHTVRSDGFLSPAERVKWYIDQGINGAAFSDHFNARGALEAKKYVEENNLNFTVLIAQEYTASEIHLNIYGIETPIIPEGWTASKGSLIMNVSDMIQYVKSHGGYVTVNHYDSPSSAPYTYEQLRDWGVDGFEIVNEGDLHAKQIRDFCLANNLACMGGSDFHSNYPINTLVKLTLPDPNNITLDAIFTELKKNNHQVIQIKPYAKNFNMGLENLGDITDVIEDFINYLFGLDVFQLTSWIIWSYIAFVFLCFFYKKMRQIEINQIARKLKKQYDIV